MHSVHWMKQTLLNGMLMTNHHVFHLDWLRSFGRSNMEWCYNGTAVVVIPGQNPPLYTEVDHLKPLFQKGAARLESHPYTTTLGISPIDQLLKRPSCIGTDLWHQPKDPLRCACGHGHVLNEVRQPYIRGYDMAKKIGWICIVLQI